MLTADGAIEPTPSADNKTDYTERKLGRIIGSANAIASRIGINEINKAYTLTDIIL